MTARFTLIAAVVFALLAVLGGAWLTLALTTRRQTHIRLEGVSLRSPRKDRTWAKE